MLGGVSSELVVVEDANAGGLRAPVFNELLEVVLFQIELLNLYEQQISFIRARKPGGFVQRRKLIQLRVDHVDLLKLLSLDGRPEF